MQMLAALRESRENSAAQFVTDARHEGVRQRVIKKERHECRKAVFCFVFQQKQNIKWELGDRGPQISETKGQQRLSPISLLRVGSRNKQPGN